MSSAHRGAGASLSLLLAWGTLSCATSGSAWMNQPLATGSWDDARTPAGAAQPSDDPPGRPPEGVRSRVLDAPAPTDDGFVNPDPGTAPERAKVPALHPTQRAPGGRTLGTFRNTYYDFPSEADFQGDAVALKSPSCKTIKRVPRAFYEAVCVQGSGTLSTGSTVSFAKRDCACAALCPRTEQHICFDELDAGSYPWGRGATGRAITPLLTVAVDSSLIPLDTPVYIPEYDGVPRDASGRILHDGCFIAQDRGVRVQGEHVDIFTGHREITALWNSLVPSNRGVTVVLDHPRCARLAAAAAR